MSDVIAQVPQHLTVVREIWCGFRDQNIIGLHKYSTTSQGSGGCHFLVHQTSPFLPRMNTGGILGWFGERLGPRPPETCRVYNRLEDWEDCRPSKDASRPGTRDHNLSPFSTGTTLKRQGRGCPVLLVRPHAAW
jgi:hypothetical protein